MNIKKTILSCMLMLGFVSASAQAPEQEMEYDFNPHWYVQVQGGLQHTLGEISFGDLLKPNVQVALGYQFNFVLGTRLAVNGWQSKAGSIYPKGGEFSWKWKYVAPTIDVTANISNFLFGVNPHRLLNVSLFAGVGANIGFDNDEAAVSKAEINKYYPNAITMNAPLDYLWDGSKIRFVGQAGVMADFRLSDKVSLGLELSANTLSDRYNSKRAKNADWYFNGLLGLKFNLGDAAVLVPAGTNSSRVASSTVHLASSRRLWRRRLSRRRLLRNPSTSTRLLRLRRSTSLCAVMCSSPSTALVSIPPRARSSTRLLPICS